jgi:hypothetical protein
MVYPRRNSPSTTRSPLRYGMFMVSLSIPGLPELLQCCSHDAKGLMLYIWHKPCLTGLFC